MTFEEEIRILQRERQKKETQERQRNENLGENVYTQYCLYCNAYLTEESKTNEEQFMAWLKKKWKMLNFFQLKHLREKYFGYKYTYDNEKQGWEIEKL